MEEEKVKTTAGFIKFLAMKFHAIIIIGVAIICNAAQNVSGETPEDRIIKDNTAEIKRLEEKLSDLKKNEKTGKHFASGTIEGIEETINAIERAKIDYSLVQLGEQLKTAQQKKELKNQIKSITKRLTDTPIY